MILLWVFVAVSFSSSICAAEHPTEHPTATNPPAAKPQVEGKENLPAEQTQEAEEQAQPAEQEQSGQPAAKKPAATEHPTEHPR
jgi:hypothetical protein